MKNVASYLKNVGQSVAYSSVDVMKKYNSTISSGLETNQDLFKEIYSSVRNYRTTYRKLDKVFKSSKIYEATDVMKTSIFEDIKSGTFYNKKREDQINQRAMGSMADFSGFDDVDLTFKDDGDDGVNWDDDSVWDTDDNFDMLDRSVRDSAKNTSNTIARTGEYIVETNKVHNGIMYAQNTQLLSKMSEGMSSISGGLDKLNSFNSSVLTTHAENSKTFYETATKLLQEQVAISKEALEMNRNLYARESKKDKPNKNLQFDDVVDAEGMPDLRKYAQIIKKNAKTAAGPMLDMMTGDMMGEGSNILLTFAASPLKFIPNYIVNSFIPNALKDTMEKFNKSLSGVFGAVIARLNYMAKDSDSNGLMQKIGEIFGIKNSVKTSIDTSKYDKGAIPFDGVVKKSIVEVIPGYLAKIEALLSGNHERIYDFKKGKWTDAKALKKEFENVEKNSINSGSSEFIDYMNKFMQTLTFESKADKKEYTDNMQKILTGIYKNGGDYRPNSADEYENLKYGVSEDSLKQFNALIATMPNNIKMNHASNVIKARSSQDRQMKDIESSGISAFTELFNNSDRIIAGNNKKRAIYDADGKVVPGTGNLMRDNNLVNSKDETGHNIFFYLKNILKEAMVIRDNTSDMVTGDLSSSYRQPIPPGIILPESNDTISTPSGIILPRNHIRRSPSTPRSPLSSDDLNSRVSIPDDTSGGARAEKDKANRAKQLEEIRFAETELRRRTNNPNLLEYDFSDETFNAKFKSHAELVSIIQNAKDMKEQEEEEGWLLKSLNDSAMKSRARLKEGEGKNKDGTDKKKTNFLDRILSADSMVQKWDVINSSLNDISKKPADFLVSTINKVDQRLYTLIYGDPSRRDREGKPIKGLMDEMVFGLQKTFNKFSSWMEEFILDPLKDKLGIDQFADLPNKILGFFGIDPDEIKKKIKGKLFGDKDEYGNRISDGILTPYTDAIKNKFGGAYNDTKGALKDTYGAAFDRMLGTERLHGRDLPPQSGSPELLDLMARNPQEAIDRMTGIIRNRDNMTPEQEMRDVFLGNIGPINQRASAKDGSRFNVRSENEKLVSQRFDNISEVFNRSTEGIDRNKDFFKIKSNEINRIVLPPNPPTPPEPIGENAKGSRYITKTGLTAISEGEMIIPSELNPLNPNRFNVNKEQEIANERKVKSDYSNELSKTIYDNIRENATAQEMIEMNNRSEAERLEGLQREKDDKEYAKRKKEERVLARHSARWRRQDPAPNNYYSARSKIEEDKGLDRHSKNAADTANEERPEINPDDEQVLDTPFGKQVLNEFKSGYTYTRDRLFGSDDPKQKNNDQDAVQKTVSDITKNIKMYAPEAVASGLLGAGVSLVTGAFGGPLLGAAAGVAIGLTRKSEVIQELLFGKVGEDGERGGAVVSKEMQQAYKKYFPDMKTLGLAGAVTGLFTPFGIAGGLVIGAGLGYAKNNTFIMETLFGKEDGLIDGDMQESIKKAYPKIAAGTLATMFLGPFGLAGNAVLGAGLGYLSSTDTFKNAMFGEETDEFDKNGKRIRKGGILGAIKESVIDPLKEFAISAKDGIKNFFERDIVAPLKNFIKPAGTEMKLFFEGLLRVVGGGLLSMFTSKWGTPIEVFLKEKLISPLTALTKFTFKAALAPAKFVAAAPFRTLGAIGNSLKQKQIMRGQANYMTAADRLAFRQDHKVRGVMSRVRRLGGDGDKALETDQLLSTMNKEDIESLMDSIGQIKNSKTYFTDEEKKIKKEISKEVVKIFDNKRKGGIPFTKRTRADIFKAIDSGDLGMVEYLLRTQKGKDGNLLTMDEQKDLSTNLKDKNARLQNIKFRKGNATTTRQELFDTMHKQGFKNIQDKDFSMSRFNDLLKTEYKDRKQKEAYGSLEDGDATFKDIGVMITDMYSQKTDELKEVMERAATTLREIVTAIKQEGTSTPADTPTREIGLTTNQVRSMNRTEQERERTAESMGFKSQANLADIKMKLSAHYSESDVESMSDNIQKNPKITNLIIKRTKSTPFTPDAVGELYKLGKKHLNRIEYISQFMEVDVKVIELVKRMNKYQYANIKLFLKAKYKIKDADEFKTIMNLSEHQVTKTLDLFKKGKGFNLSLNQLINIPEGQYQILRRNPKHFKSKVNESIERNKPQEDPTQESDPDVDPDIQTNYTGALSIPRNAVSAISEGELVVPKEENSNKLQDMLKNASESTNEMLTVNNTLVTTESAQLNTQNSMLDVLKGILRGIQESISTKSLEPIRTEYGILKLRGTTDSGIEFNNDSETADVREKIAERDGVQQGIFSKLGDFTSSVGGFLKGLVPDLSIKKEKKSLLETILGAGKNVAKATISTLSTVALIGGIPIVYDWMQKNIFPQMKNWWDTKANPALKPIVGGAVVKAADAADKIIAWLSGSGEFTGLGLPKVFTEKIVPFYGSAIEFILMTALPKTVELLFKGLPSILAAAGRGIMGLLNVELDTIFGRDKKSKKYQEKEAANSINTPNTYPSATGKLGVWARDIYGTTPYAITMPSDDKSSKSSSDKGDKSEKEKGTIKDGFTKVDGKGRPRLSDATLEQLIRENKTVDDYWAEHDAVNNVDSTEYQDSYVDENGNVVSEEEATQTEEERIEANHPKRETALSAVSEAVVRGALTPAGRGIVQNMGNGPILRTLNNIPVVNLGSRSLTAMAKPLGATVGVANRASSSILPTAITGTRGLPEGHENKGVAKFLADIPKKITKIFDNSVVKKYLMKVINRGAESAGGTAAKAIIEKMKDMVSKGILEHIAKSGARFIAKIATVTATFGLAAPIFAIFDFEKGFNEANTILGVTEQPSFPIRVVCGLVEAIASYATLGLIPSDILFNILLFILDILQIDISEIEEKRELAREERDEYNEINGTNLSLKEYNHLKNPTLWTRTKEAAGSIGAGATAAWDWTKGAASTVGTGIVDTAKATGKVWSDFGSDVGARISSAYEGASNFAADGIANIKENASEVWNKNVEAYKQAGAMISSSWKDTVTTFKTGWNSGFTAMKDSAISIKDKVVSSMNILGNKASDVWTSFGTKLSDAVSSIVDTVTDLTNDIKDAFVKGIKIVDDKLGAMLGFEDDAGVPMSLSKGISYNWDRTKEAVSSGWDTAKENVSNTFQSAKNWLGFGGGSGYGSGKEEPDIEGIFEAYNKKYGKTKNAVEAGGFGNNDHISQRDSSVSGINYNRKDDTVKQTVKDSGCGPVAATEVINSLSGNRIGVKDAVDYSLNNGFKQKDGGTTPDYFKSIFDKYNISSTQTNSQKDVVQSLNKSNPVVLLGQDKSGSGNTPFGKTSHFVTATGIDGKGNVTIQDPDSKTGNMQYNVDKLLSKSMTGITTNSIGGYGNTVDAYNAKSKSTTTNMTNRIDPTTMMSAFRQKSLEDNLHKKTEVTKAGTSPTYYSSYAGRNVENKTYAQSMSTTEVNAYPADDVNYIIHQNLGYFSDVTVEEIDAWINKKTNSSSLMRGMGKIFVEVGKAVNLDPRYLVAHAAEESAWGTSNIVRKKYNFFGIGAFDRNPGEMAYSYGGAATGLADGIKWIKRVYYTERKKTTLFLMHSEPYKYATNANWATNIARIMKGGPVNTNRVYDSGSLNTSTTDLTASGTPGTNIIGEAVNKASSIYDVISNQISGIMNKAYGEDVMKAMNGSSEQSSSSSNSPLQNVGPNSSTNAADFYLGTMRGSKLTSGWNAWQSGGKRYHKGIDIGAPLNTPIPSPVSGTVVTVKHQSDSYGNHVKIKDANGFTHIFAHMHETAVKEGDVVKRGDIIGYVGNTGNSSGNHLHYEVRNLENKSIDPNGYLASNAGLGKNTTVFKVAPAPTILPERELSSYSNSNANSTSATNNNTSKMGTGGDSGIDYTELLKIIIEALSTIAGNTDNLSKILKALNSKYDLGMTEEQVKPTNSKSSIDKLKAALQSQTNKSNGNTDSSNGMGESAMDKSTHYIMSTMSALATE